MFFSRQLLLFVSLYLNLKLNYNIVKNAVVVKKKVGDMAIFYFPDINQGENNG